MSFQSVLFPQNYPALKEPVEAPGFFTDLNLDQVIRTMLSGKQEYNLKPFFHTSLRSVDATGFRQAVMRDLENTDTLQCIRTFAQELADVRQHLKQVEKLSYRRQKQAWFIDAAAIYCDAIQRFGRDLNRLQLKSEGLLSFCDYLNTYSIGGEFTSLQASTHQLQQELRSVQYAMFIRGNSVTIRRYHGEADYNVKVVDTFQRFQQGAVEDYTVDFPNRTQMNHVEGQILERIAALYPAPFDGLEQYWNHNQVFIDEMVQVFDREIQFYIAYLDYMAVFQRVGLNFCYPTVSAESKQVFATDTFDVALAYKLLTSDSSVVCNDFYLTDPERILVVSGPNQGGKTTFARTFGQLHFLASLGLPVPGSQAALFLCDRLFTHFEREEFLVSQNGKLQDDLLLIHEILQRASSKSVLIMNEIFSSTALADAVFLGKEVMQRITEMDSLCVMVTFMDELSTLNSKTVSMVSTVCPDNPAERTYKVVRKPADGLSYALSIATKYQLTYWQLKERIQS